MATKQDTPTAETRQVPEPQATGRNSESFQSQQGLNKAAIAREIFNSTPADTPRKAVLERFMNEAHLTKAGAATYYQNMKKDAGQVKGTGGTRHPAAKPIGGTVATKP